MANAAGIRPDDRLTKLLYKVMKTPKSLQQDTKNFNPLKIQAWTKESFPNQGTNS